MNIFKLVEEGSEFTTFLSNQRFKAILTSSDANKIYHIARNYRTDDKKFECKFTKEVTATDKDLVIKIDGMTSKDLIQLKKEGTQVLADGGSFKSGRKLLLQVPRGTTASIEYPVRP